jgi:hypothetical protein
MYDERVSLFGEKENDKTANTRLILLIKSIQIF